MATTTTAALLAEARKPPSGLSAGKHALQLVPQLADALVLVGGELEAQKAISVALMRSENELQAKLAKTRGLAITEARDGAGRVMTCLLCGGNWFKGAREAHGPDCPIEG